MKDDRSNLRVIAASTLLLIALLGFRVIDGSPLAIFVLGVALAATFGLIVLTVRQVREPRTAPAGLALFDGVLSIAGAIAAFILPARALTAYEPEADWLRAIDLTPPALRWLRVALASSYFAVGLLVAGGAFFAVAYLLFHRGAHRWRHAH